MTTEQDQSSKPERIGPILYWVAACTFVWALLGPLGLRHVVGWSKFLAFGFYPASCLLAAVFLLTGRRQSLALAMVNLVCGGGWILYTYFVVEAFKAGFSR